MTAVAPLTRAAVDILRVCESLGRRACLIGGIAVQRWGQPRATQDVDVTVLAPFGSEATVVDELLARLAPRACRVRGAQRRSGFVSPLEADWRALR